MSKIRIDSAALNPFPNGIEATNIEVVDGDGNVFLLDFSKSGVQVSADRPGNYPEFRLVVTPISESSVRVGRLYP
ncbi:hypothetical protein [Curtobacterium phage Parvaparticeps]|nr:hypothetical protein [Curtobacterium phage Parvaparticeps]